MQDHLSPLTLGLTSALAALMAFPSTARAASTMTVSSMADDTAINGNCTLREAVIAANLDIPVDACPAGSGADTIVLPPGHYFLGLIGTCEDAGATGDLDIASPVTIAGSGVSSTVISAASLPYPTSDRVIQVLGGGDLTIRGVTVRGGLLGSGAGILNQGRLVVEDSRIADNEASEEAWQTCSGGFPWGGAGIYNWGDLTLRRVEITGNRVTRQGTLSVDAGGGGLVNAGTAIVESSSFSGNWAAGGSGIFNAGDLTLSDSLVRSNQARFWGAGLQNSGIARLRRTTVSANTDNGIFNGSSGVLTLVDSTVNDNHGYRRAGGIISEGTLAAVNCTVSGNDGPTGGVWAGPRATLSHCTITNNSGWYAGGLSGQGTNLLASIVAHNTGGGDCSAPMMSSGYNLDSDGSCALNAPGDLPNSTLELGLLANNGGPTRTHALLAGSPALDAIPLAACPLTTDQGLTVATDQRGAARPLGAGCDSGAYEADPATIPGPLTIDIQPKIAANVIDIAHPGQAPVAILSTPVFDAPTAIDWESLRFGRTGEEMSLRHAGDLNKPACTAVDVSGDGRPDLVCNFSVAASGLQCGDNEGVLEARLNGIGTSPMSARDNVVITPCP